MRMAAPYVTAGSIVVDVGANVGAFTKWAAQQVGPTGQVIAVEPDVRCWESLERLKVAYPQVVVRSLALGPWHGLAKLHQAPESPQSSLLLGAIPLEDRKRVTTLPVHVFTLDMLVDRADLVKIDAQGMDAAILAGAPHLLQTCPAWIVECWPLGLHADDQTPLGMLQTLQQAGLRVCWANGDDVTAENVAAWINTNPKFVNWMATR